MRRYALRNDQWDRIKDFLPGREGHVGGTAADNRLFVDAVVYRYRVGDLAMYPWQGSRIHEPGGYSVVVPSTRFRLFQYDDDLQPFSKDRLFGNKRQQAALMSVK